MPSIHLVVSYIFLNCYLLKKIAIILCFYNTCKKRNAGISVLIVMSNFDKECLQFIQLRANKLQLSYATTTHAWSGIHLALFPFALADMVCLSTTKHQAIRKSNNQQETRLTFEYNFYTHLIKLLVWINR